ncbi:MAG TPA: UbiA-like polyprenyltransferase [Gemmatimonadaceae bacterium]|nr:UbiA-like polyprenyltransferase [Gemmatimonadaceae bacterium]
MKAATPDSHVGGPGPRREGQTFAGTSRITRYVNFVKLPHTVFAMPFALVGVVLASYSAPVRWRTVAWVVVAFTCARFAAMGFNRIVDRDIDAKNPRTERRELPQGTLGLTEAWVSVVVASLVFLWAAWRLNPLCGALAPVALAWVLCYSFTKRFTSWSHLVLGVGLSIAPVGGYLAVRGAWSHPWWMLIALACAVATWSGGFDVLYALQDLEFDRREGLFSIPVALGEHGAFVVARLLHAASVCCLAAVGAALYGGSGAGSFYALGVVVAAGLLIYEHSLVRPGELTRLDAAFFMMNGITSIAFFVCVLVERLTTSAAMLYAGHALL